MAKVMINLVPFDTNHLVIGKITKTDGNLLGPNGEEKMMEGYGYMVWDEREGHPDHYGNEISAHAWSVIFRDREQALASKIKLMEILNYIDGYRGMLGSLLRIYI